MSIAIYMEGGGQGRDSKAALRLGMDQFLDDIKQEFRVLRRHWRLVCCGSRNEAYRAFRRACDQGGDAIVLLLVDAEGPVIAGSPIQHLSARDGWNFDGINDRMIHLMVQTMETWIVADAAVLSGYYGQNFRSNALSNRQNLEHEPKADIDRALNEATRRTGKGQYHKIRHASDLLARIDPAIVRQRCPHCSRLFDTLRQLAGQPI